MSPLWNNIPASPEEIAEAEAWLKNEGRKASSQRGKHSQAAPPSAVRGRRNLRQRAFAGFSLRNADALDGVRIDPKIAEKMTLEKAIPTLAVAGPGTKTVKMSSADTDPSFGRIRNGWRDDLRSESLKEVEERIERGEDPETFSFQNYAFDSGLESIPRKKEGIDRYQEISNGYGVVTLKGNEDFKGWRRESPWWLLNEKALAKLNLSEHDSDILRYFYLSHMSDDDIYEEMRMVFEILEPGENTSRHTSSGNAVKKRRLKLVKDGNQILGKDDPSAEKEKPLFSDEWHDATELDVPLGTTIATITRPQRAHPMQEPGWTQTRSVPSGYYSLECAVEGCHEFYIYPEPRRAERIYVCRNHPTRIQKAALRANSQKQKALHA
jgi:hypothetical protein